MRLNPLQPMSDTTLRLVLDDEVIECDLYELGYQAKPIVRDITSGKSPMEHVQDITYTVVARRRRQDG